MPIAACLGKDLLCCLGGRLTCRGGCGDKQGFTGEAFEQPGLHGVVVIGTVAFQAERAGGQGWFVADRGYAYAWGEAMLQHSLNRRAFVAAGEIDIVEELKLKAFAAGLVLVVLNPCCVA